MASKAEGGSTRRLGLGIFGAGVVTTGAGAAKLLWFPGGEASGNLALLAGFLVAAVGCLVLAWPGMEAIRGAIRRHPYWPGRWGRVRKVGACIFGAGVTTLGIGVAMGVWTADTGWSGNIVRASGIGVIMASWFVVAWPGVETIRRHPYWPGQWTLRSWVAVVSVAVLLMALAGFSFAARRTLAAPAAIESPTPTPTPAPAPTPLPLPDYLLRDGSGVYQAPPWSREGHLRALRAETTRLHDRLRFLEAVAGGD